MISSLCVKSQIRRMDLFAPFFSNICNYLGAHSGRYTTLAQEKRLALLNIQVYTTCPLRLLYTFRNVPAILIVKRD